MNPIRLSAHALRYRSRRGFTVAEVEETEEIVVVTVYVYYY